MTVSFFLSILLSLCLSFWHTLTSWGVHAPLSKIWAMSKYLHLLPHPSMMKVVYTVLLFLSLVFCSGSTKQAGLRQASLFFLGTHLKSLVINMMDIHTESGWFTEGSWHNEGTDSQLLYLLTAQFYCPSTWSMQPLTVMHPPSLVFFMTTKESNQNTGLGKVYFMNNFRALKP